MLMADSDTDSAKEEGNGSDEDQFLTQEDKEDILQLRDEDRHNSNATGARGGGSINGANLEIDYGSSEDDDDSQLDDDDDSDGASDDDQLGDFSDDSYF